MYQADPNRSRIRLNPWDIRERLDQHMNATGLVLKNLPEIFFEDWAVISDFKSPPEESATTLVNFSSWRFPNTFWILPFLGLNTKEVVLLIKLYFLVNQYDPVFGCPKSMNVGVLDFSAKEIIQKLGPTTNIQVLRRSLKKFLTLGLIEKIRNHGSKRDFNLEYYRANACYKIPTLLQPSP
jgi:hypothetical protein